jgi:hypothetical protein
MPKTMSLAERLKAEEKEREDQALKAKERAAARAADIKAFEKRMKEEHLRQLAEEKRREEAQKALDYSRFLANKAAEREADERRAAAREERKKKLRDALRRCTTEDDVWDVENDQDYLDWEDEELIASYKKRIQERTAKSDSNSIVDTGNPLGNSTYIPSAPVASQDVPSALGTAKLLQSTKPKMMGKQVRRL